MSSFSAKIRSHNDLQIIELHGELDAHTATELEAAIQQCVDAQGFKVIVNGAQLRYISSAGLGVFMAFIEEIRENGGDIKIAALQPNVFETFDLLGFPHLFDITETEEEAIEKFTTNTA
jgi:anti-sigma B factor antagonist